jgi:two-component system, NarL family, nitrate/nitrite response regulator NarL
MYLPEHGLRVAIIDSNPLLSNGIAALLEREIGLVTGTACLGPYLDGLEDERFDVIILDPSQGSPADLARAFGKRAGAIIGYSSKPCPILARACISAGFRGILPRTVPFETLKIALATVAQGGIYIDAAFAAAIAPEQGVEDPPAVVQETSLSARELFVLKSVAYGKSMKEIGKELDLSSKTIETYKARGSSKLNLSGRRQIVEFAIAQGWVSAPEIAVG